MTGDLLSALAEAVEFLPEWERRWYYNQGRQEDIWKRAEAIEERIRFLVAADLEAAE